MSAETWIAIIGSIAVPVIGWAIYHALHDREVQSELKSRVTRLEQDVGTHDTGMRGNIHTHGNMLAWLGGCVWLIAEKIGIQLPKRDK